MANKNKIVCVHLLNDFSGSPNMLKQAILTLLKNGFEIDVIMNKETQGFLSEIDGVKYYYVNYEFSKNKWVTLLRLIRFQIQVFLCLLSNYKSKNITLLINSSYPFSAGLYGKLFRKKVVYYIQEIKITPLLLKWFLFKILELSHEKIIFVSKFLRDEISSSIRVKNDEVIYNILDNSFLNKEKKSVKDTNIFNIIFIASLKNFKGVDTFIELAHNLVGFENILFTMQLNGKREVILDFQHKHINVKNLKIIDSSKSVHDLYSKGDLLLNLSKPSLCIETFGLTILEGFSYGIPAIVPNVGGPIEIVNDGINGFAINVESLEEIKEKVLQLYKNKEMYKSFSKEAKKRADFFKTKTYEEKIVSLFNEIET